MEDDKRPVSSAEMIRQARESLTKPSVREQAMTDDLARELLEEDEILPIERATARPRQRASQARTLPPDPFLRQGRTRQAASNPRAAAVIIGLALLVMGIAIATVLIAATAP